MQAVDFTSMVSSLQLSAATASSRSAPPLRVQAPPPHTSSLSETAGVSEQKDSRRRTAVSTVVRIWREFRSPHDGASDQVHFFVAREGGEPLSRPMLPACSGQASQFGCKSATAA